MARESSVKSSPRGWSLVVILKDDGSLALEKGWNGIQEEGTTCLKALKCVKPHVSQGLMNGLGWQTLRMPSWERRLRCQEPCPGTEGPEM